MLDQLWAGGPVMIPIVAVSVVALMTLIERAWALRRSVVCPDALVRDVLACVQREDLEGAVARASSDRSAVARLLHLALMMRAAGRARMKEKLEEAGRREAALLERHASVLGTCAAVSPLLGLLGTVQGMIQTFGTVSQGGIGDMASLAGGISVALVTTFAGLAVGIPSLIADRWVLARVDGLVLELEAALSSAVDLLVPDPDPAPDGGAP